MDESVLLNKCKIVMSYIFRDIPPCFPLKNKQTTRHQIPEDRFLRSQRYGNLRSNIKYEGEPVNRSQIDIKRKTCDIRIWEKKTFISWHILYQHWYTCPIDLPVHRNLQHKSLLTLASATSAPPFQPLRLQRNVCRPNVNHFTRQTLPTVNGKHFSMNILCIEFFFPEITTEPCSSEVHTSITVAILTTDTSLWTCACTSAT
jgi:hypothetical protein